MRPCLQRGRNELLNGLSSDGGLAPKADLLTSARRLQHTPDFGHLTRYFSAETEPSFLRDPDLAKTLEIGGLVGPDQFVDSICVAWN